MNSLFKKSLLDLVKGLRSHKEDESAFINQCLSEIKKECGDKDHDVKANAIEKLSYLYMLGYDISFAHFNIIEVMSQKAFNHKRIAYLCASLSFREDTDTFSSNQPTDPNLLDGKKFEVGTALNCLANIVTPPLAETLLEDVYGLLNSSKPYIRKKAVLVLYPIFRKFPRALRLSFDRLKSKLKDDDPGVQNAAVNVVCELARKNPSNYLPLLPQLFELLNNSNNNWMLIKLVKLLGSLIPAEPRLTQKLNEPLTHIISNTPAKSLLYECINTATMCKQMSKSMVRLCLEKLKTFVEDPDQNLKYLGLLGLNKLFKQNPRAVAQHRDLILQCLDDPDNTIRRRALELITSMVNEKNLEAIVQKLTDHLYITDGSYRDHVLEQIILVCQKNDYEYVRDFQWYIQLLTNMTHLASMAKHNAELISQQLMDVTIRVPDVRDFSVEQMESLIIDNGLIGDNHNMSVNAICRVLRAAAYIVGEFHNGINDPLTLMKAMLQNRISSLPADIQCIFIQNALKVVCAGLREQLEDDDEEDDDENNNNNNEDNKDNSENKSNEEKQQGCRDIMNGCIQLLEPLAGSPFIEVQERATAYLYFMKWLKKEWENEKILVTEQKDILLAFKQVFDNELKPVRPKHQQMMAKKIPKDLNLDKWIGEEWIDSEDELKDENSSDDDFDNNNNNDDWLTQLTKKDKKLTKEEKLEKERRNKQRKERRKLDPYMIGDVSNDSSGDSDDYDKNNKNNANTIKSNNNDSNDNNYTLDNNTNNNHKKKNIFDNLKKYHHKKHKRRSRSSKKPKIQQITKIKGDSSSSEDGTETLTAYRDPLSEAINFQEKIEMPSLPKYDQTQIMKQQDSKYEQRMKQERKRKRKNRRNKKSNKKNKKNNKKIKKKTNKKNKNKSNDEKLIDVKSNDESNNVEIDNDNILGMFDFGMSIDPNDNENNNNNISNGSQVNGKVSKDKNKNKNKNKNKVKSKNDSSNLLGIDENEEEKTHSDPFDVLGMFGDNTSDNNNTQNGSQKSEKTKKTKKPKKSKKLKLDNKKINSLKSQILFSNDDINISYFFESSNNKLILNFLTTNNSDKTYKKIEVDIKGSDNIYLAASKSSIITLGENLESGESNKKKVSLKCKSYDAMEGLNCSVIYKREKKKSKKQKLKIILLSHSFNIDISDNDSNNISDNDDLMQFIQNSNKCNKSISSNISLNNNINKKDSLLILQKIWKLNEIESSKSMFTYYGQLLKNKVLAIFVKAKKNTLSITVRCKSKSYGEALIQDFKNILQNY